MDNYHLLPYIKNEEIKLEIKWEQHETEIDEWETVNTEIDSKVNVEIKTEQKNEPNENKMFIQTENIEIKSEITEESYPQEPDELNEVKGVAAAGNNSSTPTTFQDAWKCHVCRRYHNNKEELTMHITLKHKDPLNLNLFKCGLCGFTTEYLDRLRYHLSWHRNLQRKQRKALEVFENEELVSETIEHKCRLCDSTYRTKSQLGKHTASSHKDPLDSNKFKCTICNYVTKYFHLLMLHEASHECSAGSKWYQCYKCNYRSKQKSVLKDHIKYKCK